MGVWSRLAGDVFLDWLALPSGLRWVDIGCGSGAFTERVGERCAPAEIHGVDPSEAQLAFARSRPAARLAQFQKGDAMALPFPAQQFDVAVMALVIFFVPEPAKGVAEMVRVLRPGGTAAAYAWDMLGGGYPGDPVTAEMRAMGFNPPLPPSAEASRFEALRELWTGAELEAVETREIAVERSFADFEEFWTITTSGASIGPTVKAMQPEAGAQLKERVRRRLPPDAAGRVTYAGRANAVKGRLPV